VSRTPSGQRKDEHTVQVSATPSSHLWAEQAIIDGDADVIWGLLDDIWYCYHNKISPFDTAHGTHKEPIHGTREGTSVFIFVELQRKTSPIADRSKTTFTPNINTHISGTANPSASAASRSTTHIEQSPAPVKRPPKQQHTQLSMSQNKRREGTYAGRAFRSPLKSNYYAGAAHIKRGLDGRQSPLVSSKTRVYWTPGEQRKKACNTTERRGSAAGRHSQRSQDSFRDSGKNSGRSISPRAALPKANAESERLTRGWLQLLNFGGLLAQEDDELLKNPLRNGLLLCEVPQLLASVGG
jgi:hypothetical protein